MPIVLHTIDTSETAKMCQYSFLMFVPTGVIGLHKGMLKRL